MSVCEGVCVCVCVCVDPVGHTTSHIYMDIVHAVVHHYLNGSSSVSRI